MTTGDNSIAMAARAFLSASWAALREYRVVPRPIFDPFIEVGRDYTGTALMGPEFTALEEAIKAAHPRFRDDVQLGERDHPSSYIFTFLETFVVRLGRTGTEFSPVGEPARQSINDLTRALRASSWKVACCRVVSHMTTSTGEAIKIAGVTVVPITAPPHDHRRQIRDVIDSAIPGAASVYSGNTPSTYAPPDSVIIAQGDSASPYELGRDLSNRIDQFLLVTRLLQAGTGGTLFEVQGESNPVRRFRPTLVRFRGPEDGLMPSTQLVRRTISIAPNDRRRVNGLTVLLDSVNQHRPGMFTTSFAMAVQKFSLSYHAHAWYEQVVDLATAMEAMLSGTEKVDVLLRLRSRAAALLWTTDDPASAIFADVGRLYNLRSVLVHGNDMTEKDLMKEVRAISTTPANTGNGVAVAHVVDRFRDLVRRSILARICLASGDDPRWNITGKDTAIDKTLADDSTRTQWRTEWRTKLTSISALHAADRPRLAADFLSPDDL